MMRIAMVTTSVSRSGAGITAVVEGLSDAVMRLGHEVRVFALEDDAWAEDAAAWGGAPVQVAPIVGPAIIGYAPKMLDQLEAFAADVVHLHGLWTHPARSAAQFARRAGRPCLISPHGMLSPPRLAFSAGKKRIARLLYQDRSLREATAFHATCAQEAEEIRAFGLHQPIALFPNGAVPEPPPEGVPRQPVVLALGRVHPLKGLDLLLETWARIEPAHPGWRLEIAGPDQHGHAAQLRALADRLGLARVEISGPVYGAAKHRLLAQASLFVMPSRSENFALTVVESLMMRTPVIASHGTPWAQLPVRGCGAWVPGEPAALAEAMARIMGQTEAERLAMGEAGRAFVLEEFNWLKVARQAQAAYARLVGAGLDGDPAPFLAG